MGRTAVLKIAFLASWRAWKHKRKKGCNG